MAVICGIITMAAFQLIIGFGTTAFSAFLVYSYVEMGADYESLAFISLPSLWMSLIMFGITTLFAGIIGCVAGCQRGQCVVLTYMASSIVDCVSSLEVLVISVMYVVLLCKVGKNCTKDIFGLFWVIILGCSAFVFLISLMGSGFACRSRCYCCSSSRDAEDHHEPDVMVLTTKTTPTAPPMSQINHDY